MRNRFLIKSLLLALIWVVLHSWLAPLAMSDTFEENSDDAPTGDAVPLSCVPHPSASSEDEQRRTPAGSHLCEGFILSRIDAREQDDRSFDAAIDVAVAVPPGPGPFPILVQVHGYGGSKGGAGDDAFALNEGIALVRYSTRGFGNSYGDNQLADEDVEIRDIQQIVKQIVEGTAFASVPVFSFDRKRIAITGASYGGGHSLLLAQTSRRTWPCAQDTCKLVTAVPIVPWTDLLYSLVPNGRPGTRADDPGYVLGVEKLSYVSGLYASGYRFEERYNGSSYPPFLTEYYGALNIGEPYQNPSTPGFDPVRASLLEQATKTLTLDRSPAYQDYCAAKPLPIFQIQGWTDDLFTAHEAIRMRDVLDAQCDREYPLKLYLGNTGHPRARANDPDEQAYLKLLIRDWLKHYLLDEGPAPAFDATTGITPPPGERFDPATVVVADEIEDLAGGSISKRFELSAVITQSPGTPTGRDLKADPIVNEAGGDTFFGGHLGMTLDTTGALAGDSAVLRLTEEDVFGQSTSRTLCGAGTVSLTGTVDGTDTVYAVRVWDIAPDGTRYLVDRGIYRNVGLPGRLEVEIPLHGNAWRFRRGHEVIVEVTNSDNPYLRPNNLASLTRLSAADVLLPTCESTGIAVLGTKLVRPAPGLAATGASGLIQVLGGLMLVAALALNRISR